MKVEIEYEEIERLRFNVAESLRINKELADKLKSLNEDELKSQAEGLALELAKEYLVATFKSLGFADTTTRDIKFYEVGYYRKWLGNQWHDSENLKSIVSIHISNEYKAIFTKMWAEVNGEQK